MKSFQECASTLVITTTVFLAASTFPSINLASDWKKAPTMGNEQSYFLVPVTSGLCIEPNRSYYDLLYTAIPDQKNLNQQWILEQQGSKVAFRNAEKKDYLKALGSHNQAQVRMQATPQWWSLEPGRTAGSFW